jgi:hypothetical protein
VIDLGKGDKDEVLKLLSLFLLLLSCALDDAVPEGLDNDEGEGGGGGRSTRQPEEPSKSAPPPGISTALKHFPGRVDFSAMFPLVLPLRPLWLPLPSLLLILEPLL